MSGLGTGEVKCMYNLNYFWAVAWIKVGTWPWNASATGYRFKNHTLPHRETLKLDSWAECKRAPCRSIAAVRRLVCGSKCSCWSRSGRWAISRQCWNERRETWQCQKDRDPAKSLFKSPIKMQQTTSNLWLTPGDTRLRIGFSGTATSRHIAISLSSEWLYDL